MTRSQGRWSHLRKIAGVVLVLAAGSLVLGGGRAQAEMLTGLTSTGNLVTFDSGTPGTSVTTLFGIDSNRDVLVMQGGPDGVPSPNNGVLTTIGAGLGFNTSDLVGFDVSGTSGVALASLVSPTGGPPQLFTIDLATGSATLVGAIGTGLTLTGLAADVGAGRPAVPVPPPLALLAAGALGFLALARRRRAAAA